MDSDESQHVIWACELDRGGPAGTRKSSRKAEGRQFDPPGAGLSRALAPARVATTGQPALRFPCIGEAPVTAKPRDGMTAAVAGRGRLRASHADREYVLNVLKAAFVQGRLTKDEFDLRVGQTLASRIYAELAALTADIPAGLIGVQPVRKSARAQAPHRWNKVVNSCACAGFAVLALAAVLFTGNFALFFTVVVAILGILFVAGGRMAYSSHKKRSTRHQW